MCLRPPEELLKEHARQLQSNVSLPPDVSSHPNATESKSIALLELNATEANGNTGHAHTDVQHSKRTLKSMTQTLENTHRQEKRINETHRNLKTLSQIRHRKLATMLKSSNSNMQKKAQAQQQTQARKHEQATYTLPNISATRLNAFHKLLLFSLVIVVLRLSRCFVCFCPDVIFWSKAPYYF